MIYVIGYKFCKLTIMYFDTGKNLLLVPNSSKKKYKSNYNVYWIYSELETTQQICNQIF